MSDGIIDIPGHRGWCLMLGVSAPLIKDMAADIRLVSPDGVATWSDRNLRDREAVLAACDDVAAEAATAGYTGPTEAELRAIIPADFPEAEFAMERQEYERAVQLGLTCC